MNTYNKAKLLTLLEDFYTLTGIKICIYDNAENEICYFPEKFSSFCATLRTDAAADARCRECDRRAFAICKRTHEQYIYTCHAGLLECVSPILHEGVLIGYVFIGQIRPDAPCRFEDIAHRLPEPLRDALRETFQALPPIEENKLRAATRVLDACTGYEYLRSWIRENERKIDARMEEYISAHLADPLSVASLCAEFHLSHSEIYAIFKEYFGSTVAEYIKLRRLERACALLKETSLPVSHVARVCGIGDYNYFSKVFRRAYGKSPRAYRKDN